MTRKLFLAISLASLSFSSMYAHALGVGEANVKSALNQPLVAEIELLSVGELTEAEILPALATREEFDRAGVDRVFFLSDIRFNVVKNASGKLMISLSSKKPVRDPYLSNPITRASVNGMRRSSNNVSSWRSPNQMQTTTASVM